MSIPDEIFHDDPGQYFSLDGLYILERSMTTVLSAWTGGREVVLHVKVVPADNWSVVMTIL